MEYVLRMGGGNLVAQTLSILTVITHVRVGHAGQLLSFTKENYPDPRVQFGACNRPRASWVCDPGKYLTAEQADEIDQRINGLPGIGSQNAMIVGIVPRIVLADGSPATSALVLRDFTAYQFQNVWSRYAQSTLVIVYHVSRNEVWTQTATNLVTALCICQTTYETRQYLATGDLGTVVDVFTQKFTGVLSGTSTCSTTSNNVPYMIDSSTGVCTWTIEITISSLVPPSGLPEGGTEVVITGQNLDLSSGNVVIGNLNCQLISHTTTKVTCQTSALQNAAYLNIPMPVFLLLGGQEYNTGRRFVYTKPTLLDVQPRTTTVSGGLQLTVQGTNLNLVTTASMMTLLKGTRTGRQTLSTTECQVRDSTSMLCPTPALDIEGVLSQISRRHVRSHRAARAAGDDNDASTPVEDVEMSVTFNVNRENSPLQNGQPAAVKPYADPVLYPFESEQRTLTFISVWPESERMVDIKGTGLLPALKDHTLSLEVGAGFCDVQEMASNLLVCKPPVNEPEKKLSNGPHPAVMAHVGNQQFDIGYLQYYDTLWKYPLTRYAIIGAAAALLLILLVIVVCCCSRKTSDKKKRRKRNKQNRKQ